MSGNGSDNGWLEAAIAWEVCASLHRQYCKGKDALFTTRQSDFVKHAENARWRATHGQAPAAGAVAGSDDLSGTLRRLDSKELAAWVDRGMALSENLAMYVQADCTLRESQARDMLRAHLFSAQPAPAAPTSPAKAADSVLEDAALLKEARDALWQPANAALCERIDAYLDAARKQGGAT